MRAVIAKKLRKQADDLFVRGTPEWRNKYRQLKRIHTTKGRHGVDAFSGYAAKTPHAAQVKGGQTSPANFKNNPKLAAKAGKIGKRGPVASDHIRQVKV